jgi:DNA-binding transcriptional LysR family regulator
LRAAARRLGLSPSTVLEHIRRLESELDASLLVRRRGAVQPTAQGALLLPLARRLVDTAARARAAVAGGAMRLAASTNLGTYILPPRLAAFRSRFGGEIDLWIGPNPDVAARIAGGGADIALMEWWDEAAGLRALAWQSEPLSLIVAPGHRWAARASITVAELLEEPLLGGERGSGTGTLLRRLLGERFAGLRTVPGFGNTEAVKRAVRAGLGVSIVHRAGIVDELAAGTLKALTIEGVALQKPSFIVMPETAPPGGAPARFAAFLQTAGHEHAG